MLLCVKYIELRIIYNGIWGKIVQGKSANVAKTNRKKVKRTTTTSVMNAK